MVLKSTDETLVDEANASSVLSQFRLYATELTARHDRQERLLRISRDITIESKNIIFYLHSIKSDEPQKLETAEKRLQALIAGPFKKAALELKLEDVEKIPTPRVLQPAVEEFTEAYCFLEYIKNPNTTALNSWENIQNAVHQQQEEPYLLVHPIHFMLGVTDFTGELMRLCINTAANDKNDTCLAIRKMMQMVYTGFLGVRANKEFNNKLTVMKQSLHKVEDTCYNLKIRTLQM